MFETWQFITDPESRGPTAGWPQNGLPETAYAVTIPHTVNVEEGFEEYRGPMWYACTFSAEEDWTASEILLHFGGVYRDADFWMNGEKIGSHYDSGFAPFTIDATGTVKAGENLLVIRVDNAFSMRALPIDRSFDWADDGGMIRGVELQVVRPGGIRSLQVHAKPLIAAYGTRVDSADVEICVTVDGSADTVEIYDGETLVASLKPGVPAVVPNLILWHFDNPKLYRAVAISYRDGAVYDQKEVSFGAREFITQGAQFVLNGESVRLCGVEWMPGSNPAYGNAEPVIYLKKILKQLKESNCVFTRFHWQQDDAIYDWCDRHGMLVQEEIPNWGGQAMDEGLLEVSRRQALEMVQAHGNHPSIVSWGVGNEMRGQEDNTIHFLEQVRDIFRELDPDRLVNYVSNTWWRGPVKDAVAIGDSMWINEYFGTWVQGRDVVEDLDALVAAGHDKPIVISEFGVCEPAFPGGDVARTENLVEKMKLYRTYPEIGATIHFSLNDYRTQMGEEGEGKLRRRVHGSTDIYGNVKPSYAVLQHESAPIMVDTCDEGLTITCRSDLPCHAVKGYRLVQNGKEQIIPDLKPGESTTIQAENGAWKILRPNGDKVL